MQLHNLEPLHKKRKRVGRGGARGGTSGRGHKGQKARPGNVLPAFFEGGQMPLSRRLPRRGFTNIFKTEYVVINLRDLEKRFENGATVNVTTLKAKGLINGNKPLIKILSAGTLSKKLTVQADAYSKSALEAIKKAGGVAEVPKKAVVEKANKGV